MNLFAIKLSVFLASILGLVTGAWWLKHEAYKEGYSVAQAEFAARSLDIERDNHNQQVKQLDTVLEAQNEHKTKLRTIQADADRVRDERDRLRNELAAASSLMSATATSTNTNGCTAERELLDAMGEGINQLARKGAEIARNADTHSADALMLQSAWPK